MSVAPRPPSKERKKENPPGTQNDNTSSGASIQNLVSTDGIDLVNEREIYSDESDEDMVGGAYGGYAAELIDGDMPVNPEEYLSDNSIDSELCYDYRNRFTPPTPPHPRLESGETAYRVISDDDDLDMSSYFSDADPDDD